MTAEERMDQLYETVEYDEVRPWREIDELATSEDEPEDEDPVPSKKQTRKLSVFFGRALMLLEGTSEGAIKGWETRRRGGTKWDKEREDDWRQKDGRFWQRTGTKNDGGKLTVTGITLPPEIAMQVLGDRDPSEVVSNIFSQVDGDVEVELTKGIVFKGKPAVTMLLKRADGLKIQRTLVMTDKGLIAEHDSFEVPEGIQGAGLAKKVMADSYDTYKEMGVKRVELHANLSVGGYAWAKYGMKATNPRKAAERFDAELRKRDGSWEPRQQGAMRAIIEKYRNDPKLPWHLAGLVTKDGRQIGKELMLGSAWGATLDMNDEEATNRLKHYVMSKG
jgi:hypothetical protein